MIPRYLLALALCLYVLPAAALPVQVVQSPGGITAWLVEDHSVPVVSIKFAFRGGVEQDSPEAEGLSTMMADMLTEGAGSRDSARFQQALADHGITFGVDAGRDTLDGTLRAMSAELPMATTLARDALVRPRFHRDDIDRMKQMHVSAIRARLAEPDWQARRALFLAIFSGHPYAFRSYGTEANLARVTRADLVREHRRRLARDNLMVAAVGDITPEKLRQVVDRIFGALPAHATLRPVAEVQVPAQGVTVQVRQESGQSVLLFAAPGIKRDDPDWHAATILNYILGGGGFSSRLMDDVRDRRGLTYGISTSLQAMDHTGIWLGQVATANDKAGEAWDATRAIWEKTGRDGVTETELMHAKSYLIGALPTGFTSTAAIAGVLSGMQAENLPPDYLDHRTALLESVTLEDVRRVAQRLLDPSRLTLVAVGKPVGIKADRIQDFVNE
ncbi:MAG: pitrilysin family protein [Alphaproteobacteria bacterium]